MAGWLSQRSTISSVEEEAIANLAPATTDPEFFDNVPAAVGESLLKGGAAAAQTLHLAGAVVPIAIDKFLGNEVGKGPSLAGSYFEAMDDLDADAVRYWTPDERTTGTAGRVLGGIAEFAVPLLAGGGNPLTTAITTSAQATTSVGADLARAGVSGEQAGGVAAVQGVANLVGAGFATRGTTLMTRAAFGAGANIAVNVPADAASAAILDGTNQSGRFDPLSVEARSVDLIVGALFGAMTRPDMPPPKVADIDAALVVQQQQHAQYDAAPGVIDTPAAARAQMDNIEAAQRAIIDGGDPPEPRTVDFKPDPAREQQDAVRRALLEDAVSEYRPYFEYGGAHEAKMMRELALQAGGTMDWTAAAAIGKTLASRVDEVTGFYPKPAREGIMARAFSFQQATGRPVVYSSMDIANLSGLNAEGGAPFVDKQVFTPLAAIIRKHVEAAGAEGVDFIRHGGDEFSLVAFGADAEKIREAIRAAAVEFDETIVNRLISNQDGKPMSETPNKKGGAPGTGLYEVTSGIGQFSDSRAVIEGVDSQVEAKKIVRVNAYRKAHGLPPLEKLESATPAGWSDGAVSAGDDQQAAASGGADVSGQPDPVRQYAPGGDGSGGAASRSGVDGAGQPDPELTRGRIIAGQNPGLVVAIDDGTGTGRALTAEEAFKLADDEARQAQELARGFGAAINCFLNGGS